MFQGPSASAYVTYLRSEDALRAIQAVNNIYIDGRTLKASLGTTKYCSHFMKNQSCPKNDCMYLHELGKEFELLMSQRGNVKLNSVPVASVKCTLISCVMVQALAVHFYSKFCCCI